MRVLHPCRTPRGEVTALPTPIRAVTPAGQVALLKLGCGTEDAPAGASGPKTYDPHALRRTPDIPKPNPDLGRFGGGPARIKLCMAFHKDHIGD